MPIDLRLVEKRDPNRTEEFVMKEQSRENLF